MASLASKSLSQTVIKAAHDSEISCHGGFSKTLSRIRQKYFWPNMKKDIKAFIDNCDICKCLKSTNAITRPLMGNKFMTNRPFQRFYCDFLGPYPITKAKNSVIFICLDHLTKFIFLTPLKAATSTKVILFFQTEIFPTFGVPEYIHSDNAKQFTSKEMCDFFKLYEIKHITTGFYAPHSNASERANREIITKLRYFLKDQKEHSDWDKFIPQILSVLRSDYHSSIRCSPYYATFGQNMIQHGSSYGILEKLGCMSGEDVDIQNSVDRLSKIREIVKENLNTAHEKASKTYNLRSRAIEFKLVQIVYRKNHILSNMSKRINRKFMPKFVKCKIRERFGRNLYGLEDLKGKYIGKYHTSDLKP